MAVCLGWQWTGRTCHPVARARDCVNVRCATKTCLRPVTRQVVLISLADHAAVHACQPVEIVVVVALIEIRWGNGAHAAMACGDNATSRIIGQRAVESVDHAIAQRVADHPAIEVVSPGIGVLRCAAAVAPDPATGTAEGGIADITEQCDRDASIGCTVDCRVQREAGDTASNVIGEIDPATAWISQAGALAGGAAAVSVSMVDRIASGGGIATHHLHLACHASERTVGVTGLAGLVGHAGQTADCVGYAGCATVVFKQRGGPCRVAYARNTIEHIVEVRGRLAARINDSLEIAVCVIGLAGSAGVGAVQGGLVAQAIDGIGGGEVSRVLDAGQLTQPIVAIGNRRTCASGDRCWLQLLRHAIQCIKTLVGDATERVGDLCKVAVGIICVTVGGVLRCLS